MTLEHPEPPTFTTFLSHSYGSPDINLYFWELMSQVANVQFEVDVGTFSTSTTRLERMIRAADSFIGVYPLPIAWSEEVDRPRLLEESRYFRLELDMALRARKPTLVFFDRRYARTFPTPAGTTTASYDVQEVSGRSGSPSRHRLQRAFLGFCEQVVAYRKARAARMSEPFEDGVVGVLLPPSAMPSDPCALLIDALGDLPIEPVLLPWPPVLNLAFMTQVRRCDWVVVETSCPEGQAALAFLRGHAVPVLRIRHTPGGGSATEVSSAAETLLFSGFEVGYRKDVVSWASAQELSERVGTRTKVVLAPRRRIQGTDGASAYFRAAAQRREPVFLSYAQQDAGTAKLLSAALRARFASVFDYREKDALTPGRPWLDELHGELAEAEIGVLLVSRSYVASSYCMDEARTLTDGVHSRKLHLYPVKVDDVEMPAFLKSFQYFRLSERQPEEIVARVMAELTGQPPQG